MISRNEIKRIRSLKLKKYRILENKFLVEGVKNVNEVLNSDFKVHNLFATEKVADSFLLQNPSIVTEKQLKEISSLASNSTCLAVVEMKNSSLHIDRQKHLFVLDDVSDPGNLGTIIRTIDWFGFEQVICTPDCAEFYNPKTISATMGSFTRIQPQYADPAFLSQVEGDIFGMVMDGEPIEKLHPEGPSVFILGSESHGIRPSLLGKINRPVTIQGKGKADSLNVAIAASILCYQLSLGKGQ